MAEPEKHSSTNKGEPISEAPITEGEKIIKEGESMVQKKNLKRLELEEKVEEGLKNLRLEIKTTFEKAPLHELKAKEITLEEKFETIKNFLGLSLEEKFPFKKPFSELFFLKKIEKQLLENKEKKIKGWLESFSLSEVEKLWGPDLELVWKLSSFYFKEVKPNLTDLRQLEEKGGKEMISIFARQALEIPKEIYSYLSFKKKTDNFGIIPGFKKLLLNFGQKNLKEIEKIIFPEKEPKKEIKFVGFPEKMKEVAKEGVNILPQEILGTKLKTMSYKGRKSPVPTIYGAGGWSAAKYYPPEGEIEFFDTPKKTPFSKLFENLENITQKKIIKDARVIIFFEKLKENFINIVAHEGGHVLDPRFTIQEKLSFSEQIEIIKEWEEIREKDEEFSFYVLEIKNKNKKLENCLKSQEGFAETIEMFLTQPGYLYKKYRKRYEFCRKWLEKQFPEENFTKPGKDTENNIFYPRVQKIYSGIKNLFEKIIKLNLCPNH